MNVLPVLDTKSMARMISDTSKKCVSPNRTNQMNNLMFDTIADIFYRVYQSIDLGDNYQYRSTANVLYYNSGPYTLTCHLRYDLDHVRFKFNLILSHTNVKGKGLETTSATICVAVPIPKELVREGDVQQAIDWTNRLTEKLNTYTIVLDKVPNTRQDIVVTIPWFNQDAHPYLI